MNDKQVIQELIKMDHDNKNVNLMALYNPKNVNDQHYINLNMRITPTMYKRLIHVHGDVEPSTYKTIK